MGSSPAGTQHCEQSLGLVSWLSRQQQTQQAMDQAQALWLGEKADGTKDRDGLEVTA